MYSFFILLIIGIMSCFNWEFGIFLIYSLFVPYHACHVWQTIWKLVNVFWPNGFTGLCHHGLFRYRLVAWSFSSHYLGQYMYWHFNGLVQDCSISIANMMTSSDGNIFRVTGPLCGEFTGHRWIPHVKGQWHGALMFSLIWFWINGWVNNRWAGDLRSHRAHYAVNVIKALEVLQSCTKP